MLDVEANFVQGAKSIEFKKYNRRMDEKKRFRVIETTAQG